MSIILRGQKFHYRFTLGGHQYSGPCHVDRLPDDADAATIKSLRKLAEAEEKELRRKLREADRDIRTNRSVKALVENYRKELSGGKEISLAEAFELAIAKPSSSAPSDKHIQQQRKYWGEFVAFMTERYPDVNALFAVRKGHCEEFVSYMVRSGRFVKEVTASVSAGRRRKKRKEVTYTRDYMLAPKTIHMTASACAWVFRRLSEDAGLVRNPWDDIILPKKDPVEREVFTHDELQLIWEGIQNNAFCYPLFLIAANSGMTEGDICTLEWNDIDWSANCIRRKRRKTGASILLPLLPQLREYLETLPRNGKYVLPDHAEMYLNPSSRSGVSGRVISFLQSIGICTTADVPGRRRVSVKDLHSMRHVFCYRAIQAGIPRSSVAKMVGHMDEKMTAHYADHETVEDLNREISKLSSPFAGAAHKSNRQRLAELASTLPDDIVNQIVEGLNGYCGMVLPANREYMQFGSGGSHSSGGLYGRVIPFDSPGRGLAHLPVAAAEVNA